METQTLDFISIAYDKWAVYAKDSQFQLGFIEWSDDKKAYDYKPNTNGKMMKLTQNESAHQELLAFCSQRTSERAEAGGNK